ncbi:HYExAFE family protein [Telmatocola sphagniphila]|jgi:hypothetical protein|uniref:HYExAFE family protein n=1 Tax=Telmatocola sphagniphila TaxID=1123043 RepID=A0A8E6B4X4_9BACT|nr:HYExAFE family protein [Telmatocola sphagniphila]QVL30573.1 HYExAFE family protein [Telmatocola sphagniphila]
MIRSNHYETAFEQFLRFKNLGYVAIDESRRATLDDEPVKSLDFIVYGSKERRLLVDVKGRKFPGGTASKPKKSWESWSTLEDINGLRRWEERFGEGYRGILVFVYHIQEEVDLPIGTTDLLYWRDSRYLVRGIAGQDYRRSMRVRSTKWGTVDLPREEFRTLVKPFSDFLD